MDETKPARVKIGSKIFNLDNITVVTNQGEDQTIMIRTFDELWWQFKSNDPAYSEATRFYDWYSSTAKTFPQAMEE